MLISACKTKKILRWNTTYTFIESGQNHNRTTTKFLFSLVHTSTQNRTEIWIYSVDVNQYIWHRSERWCPYVQSLKTREIADTNEISPALLLSEHDNSFSRNFLFLVWTNLEEFLLYTRFTFIFYIEIWQFFFWFGFCCMALIWT
jgi:hypothetical protein